MKITLDLPDNTICSFIDIITAGEEEYFAKASVYSDALYDGAEIKIEVEEE